MKVLITGASGQLGVDLVRALSCTLHDIVAKPREELNVADAGQVSETFLMEKPHAVIHTAAYTNVDKAETEVEKAYGVNSLGTWNVAEACRNIGAKLVYISTVNVFDGEKKEPYTERDRPNPLNIYGNSKLLGEKFISILCERSFIVRTSWLYGKHGDNFVSKVISHFKRRTNPAIAVDQVSSPTYSLDLARFIVFLIETEKFGIYHASNKGYCSQYEFTREILSHLPRSGAPLPLIRQEEAFRPFAFTPLFSALGDEAIRLNGFPEFRDWKDALQDFLQEEYEFE